MTRLRFILGILAATAIGVGVVIAARRLRRRLVPSWSGPEAALADIVVTLSIVTVVSDIAGAFGAFRAVPLALGLVGVALVAVRFGRGADASRPVAATRARRRDWKPYAVAASIGVVASAWMAQLGQIWRNGIFNYDSLWYHMPMAADFVRSGRFMPVRLYSADLLISTYPAGSEVVHALGIVVVGSDVLTPFVNFAWAGLAIFSAHVLGRSTGRPHSTTLAAVLVLALPVVIELEALSALNDVMGLAGLAAAIAFVSIDGAAAGGVGAGDPDDGEIGREHRGRLLLVGLALGLAISTKMVLLAPAMLLALGVVLHERRERQTRFRHRAVPLGAGMSLTGLFWYLRDVIVFGSPIPTVRVGLGRFALPTVVTLGKVGLMIPTLLGRSDHLDVAHTLNRSFGLLWLMMVAGPVAVAVVSLVRPVSPLTRILALVGAGSVAIGAFAPNYVVRGTYLLLLSSSRFLVPGIMISLFAFCGLFPLGRWTDRATGFLTFAVVVTGGSWFVTPVIDLWYGRAPTPSQPLVAVGFAVVAGVVTLVVRSQHRARNVSVAVVCALPFVLSVIMLPTYLTNRYRQPDLGGAVYRWADAHSGRTIAIEPFQFFDQFDKSTGGAARLPLLYTYPLYGRAGANRVESVVETDGNRVTRPDSCPAWWRQLRRMGATEVLLLIPHSAEPSRYVGWTLSAPSTKVVARADVHVAGAELVLAAVDPTAEGACGDKD